MIWPGLFDRLSDFHDDLFRNVLREEGAPEAAFDDLTSDSKDWRAAQKSVDLTGGLPEPMIERPFRPSRIDETGRQQWGVSRFADGQRYGVWYGALTAETTIRETAYHWLRRVMAARFESGVSDEVTTPRTIFAVRADALLVNLRGKEKAYGGLIDRKSYAFTHPIGAYLFEQETNGLIVKSARHSVGVCAAVLKPQRLSNPRLKLALRYLWDRPRSVFRCIDGHGRTVISESTKRWGIET
jgi:hypothetical protein